jgi:hypothetical protein
VAKQTLISQKIVLFIPTAVRTSNIHTRLSVEMSDWFSLIGSLILQLLHLASNRLFCHKNRTPNIKIGTNTLPVLSHTRLTLTKLPWKLNRLLLCKLLLFGKYRIKMKSVRPVTPISTKLSFHVWVPRARIVGVLNMSQIKFYLGRWYP